MTKKKNSKTLQVEKKEITSNQRNSKRIGVWQFLALVYGGVLTFLSPVKSEQLPENVYGIYQFWSTAGYAVVGKLTITRDYFIFGNNTNGICSGSFEVKRLRNSRKYPNQLAGDFFRKDIEYEIYLLSMKKPPCNTGVDSLQIAFSNKDKKIKKLDLVTYKKDKLSGWYSLGKSITKISKPIGGQNK